MKQMTKSFGTVKRVCGRAVVVFFIVLFLIPATAASVLAAESKAIYCVYVYPAAGYAGATEIASARLNARGTVQDTQPAGGIHLASVSRYSESRASGFSSHEPGNYRFAYLKEGNEDEFFDDYDDLWGPADTIRDPLEPMNRAFFHFNDKLYFWFMKPVAQGYRAVVPKPARVGVSNFFYNLAGPIRLVNCLLQGKGEEAGYEFVRLVVNTTLGLGGFLDVATHIEVEKYNEDLGQTLGVYGFGPSFYIHWPFLGPSSARDTVGLAGDSFLNPLSYLALQYNAGMRACDQINDTSFTIGSYEDLKRSAIDPYVAIRDAYFQYREDMILR